MSIEYLSDKEGTIFPVIYIFIFMMIFQYLLELYLTCRQLKCLKIKEIPQDLKCFSSLYY